MKHARRRFLHLGAAVAAVRPPSESPSAAFIVKTRPSLATLTQPLPPPVCPPLDNPPSKGSPPIFIKIT